MSLAAGTKLDGYEVVSLLGAGGMGEVYRARDPVLKREVAIKVLPSFVSQDPDHLRRFQQEARAAAALNHPNILAVYQLGTFEGTSYLVSELLEGATLRRRLRDGPLAVRNAIDYGMQIAHGLAAAHEKGIVHRDLKPENIFIVAEGRAKILDFGLAKLTQPETAKDNGETVTMQELTVPGQVMGTLGYMSPEQVRGQSADHRADIFAFGAILYEMLARQRAFKKPTTAETMAAILHEDPPDISQIAAGTSPALLRIVRRCLEKKPEQRFQSASDLAFALEALSVSSVLQKPGVAAIPRWRASWTWPAAVGVVALLAAILFAWWRTPPAVPSVESVTQLTDDGEPKGDKLVSDGSRIYFNEGPAGSLKIAQVSVTGGRTSLVNTRLDDPYIAGLTQDGSSLLALAGGIADSAYPLWSIPLPAGEPRRLNDIAGQDANLFPDGRLVFARGRDLMVADKDGSNPHKLVTMTGIVIIEQPSVAADGRQIVFSLFSRGWSTSSLWEIGADGTGLRTVRNASQGPHVCCGRYSPDGKYLLYGVPQSGASDLWAFPLQTGLLHLAGKPVRLTAGPLSYSGAVPSRDGKQIYAVGTKKRGEVVHYDMKVQQFLPFLSGISALHPNFSADGKWVAYISYPDHTLWRSRSDGSDRMQLTYAPVEMASPRISPDGTRVTFQNVDWDVLVMSMDGGTPQLIAKHSGGPNWSPDGNLILFTSYTDAPIGDNTRSYLQIFEVGSGETSEVPSSRGIQGGVWVTQDTLVAVPYRPTKFVALDLKTKKWSDLIAGNVASWAVTPDGKYLYFTTGGAEPKVQRLRFAGRQLETITSLKDLRPVIDFEGTIQIDLAPDGSLIFTRDIGTQEIYALNIHWP
jgi:eukaryotic-like serine/threonine-protein kinase